MSLMPAICACCGAEVAIDPTTKRGVCRFCENAYIWDEATGSYINYIAEPIGLPAAKSTAHGPSAEKYIKLAMCSLEAGTADEAFLYAKKALEIQPDSPFAWVIKMMTVQAQDMEHVANEILAYGNNAIRCAEEENRAQIKKLVYRHYLSHAIIMMAAAVAKEQDASDLRRLLTENDEAESASVAGVLAAQALSLKGEIPESHFDGSGSARKQVVRLCNLYIDYWKARGKEVRNISAPSNARERTLKKLMHSLTDDEKRLVNGYVVPTEAAPEQGKFSIPIAVYGSYDCPKVWMLRRYRDQHLKTSRRGRIVLALHSRISATLMKYFGQTQWFWRFCKNRLDKLVYRLQAQGIDASRYRDDP